MLLMRLEVTDMCSPTILEVSDAAGRLVEVHIDSLGDPTTWANALLLESLMDRPRASSPVIGAYIASDTPVHFS